MKTRKTISRIMADPVSQFLPNPAWEESEECRNAVWENSTSIADFEAYYPDEKTIPAKGAWLMILQPPSTEFTVPPFSIWYGRNWPMDCGERHGVKPKRVRIITPKGNLGLWPHEYSLVKDIKQYVGREPEGIFFHRLDGDTALDPDRLFYLMSRGISRQEACMLMLDQIQGMSFGWFEIAPHYGEYFGQEWPTVERCPFARPRKLWKATNVINTKDGGWRMKSTIKRHG